MQHGIRAHALQISPAKLCDFNLVSRPIRDGEVAVMKAVCR